MSPLCHPSPCPCNLRALHFPPCVTSLPFINMS
jgi:hypothetical protein